MRLRRVNATRSVWPGLKAVQTVAPGLKTGLVCFDNKPSLLLLAEWAQLPFPDNLLEGTKQSISIQN